MKRDLFPRGKPFCLVFVCCLVIASATLRTAASQTEQLYTKAQAERGKPLYAQHSGGGNDDFRRVDFYGRIDGRFHRAGRARRQGAVSLQRRRAVEWRHHQLRAQRTAIRCRQFRQCDGVLARGERLGDGVAVCLAGGQAIKEELFDIKDHGKAAYDRAPQPKKYVLVPGITHYGIYNTARAEAVKLAIEWFDQYLKK